jgi:ribosomal protein S27E
MAETVLPDEQPYTVLLPHACAGCMMRAAGVIMLQPGIDMPCHRCGRALLGPRGERRVQGVQGITQRAAALSDRRSRLSDIPLPYYPAYGVRRDRSWKK